MPPQAGAPRPPGLLGSLGQLARTMLGVVRTRLEILGTELEEERIRFAQFALLVAGIAFCLQLAVLLFVILMVVLFWETHRLIALGVFAGFFLAVAIVGIAVLRHRLRTRPRMFANTIDELLKDERRLGGGTE